MTIPKVRHKLLQTVFYYCGIISYDADRTSNEIILALSTRYRGRYNGNVGSETATVKRFFTKLCILSLELQGIVSVKIFLIQNKATGRILVQSEKQIFEII